MAVLLIESAPVVSRERPGARLANVGCAAGGEAERETTEPTMKQKRLIMQLFRTIVTVCVVGAMAVMIFSLKDELARTRAKAAALRTPSAPPHVFSMSCKVTSCGGELATPDGRARAIAWFRTNHVTKLWLESYRHGERVETPILTAERDAFRAAGFDVCGMITPTRLNDPDGGGEAPIVTCWSDKIAQSRLAAESARAAKIFDTIIIDDFLFSSCGDSCARCKAEKDRRGIRDWGFFRRELLKQVALASIINAGQKSNPNVHFIIKYPCWYENWAQRGYDPIVGTRLFGESWIGTETRDANPNPVQGCMLMDAMDRLTDGKCGGGWYDALDCTPEKFVEQARYTILGGARESLVHCYDYLIAADPGKTPFGEKADRSHACAAAFSREVDGLARLAELLRGAERTGWEWQTDGELKHTGVSQHRFRKGGRRYLVCMNTTDAPRTSEIADGRRIRKILALPDDAAGRVASGDSDRSTLELAPHGLLMVEAETDF